MDVVQEVERLQTKYILFVDDNLFLSPSALKVLATALIPLHIAWGGQISVDAARDPELIRSLSQSGCVAVLIGFESLHAGNLAQMHKSWNRSIQAYETAIKTLYDHGIMICGTFVFGYDHDTPDSFKRCVEFTLRWKLFLAHFNLLIPYPGTTLYARLQQEGRLINDPWWLNPNFQYGQAAFHPRGMTAEELTRGCFWARKQFNSLFSIAQRAIHPQANIRNWTQARLYVLANLITRTEIYRKQGAVLGHETDTD
jgi:radical SAM superfamily enzyme YgiQ (UPF0313 family)